MTHIDPKRRPTMEEAMRRLDEIILRLSSWKLRSRATPADEWRVLSFFRWFSHWKEQIKLAHQGFSPIPNLPERLASERQRRHLWNKIFKRRKRDP